MIRWVPNALSLFRVALVAPVVWTLSTQHYEAALGLFAVAGVSDALDGGIAKRFHCSSALGAFLDPAADKLLALGTYSALATNHLVPWWLLGVMVGRDVVIVGGAAIYRWKRGPFRIEPVLTSKVATGLLILIGLAFVVNGVHPYIDSVFQGIMAWILGAILIVSGLDYIFTWGLRFARIPKEE